MKVNYRVVLADDEQEVLMSFQNNIPWETYGFEIAGAFQNGKDVLDFLENEEADVVFTDIRMPFMDGISLASNIREKYPYMKLVIISGYDDFYYAKEAMSCGVMEYILKPVNVRDMEKVLQKVRQVMDRELNEKKNIHYLEQQYQATLPIIRDNFLNRLVAGNISSDILEHEMEMCDIHVRKAVYWTVALVQVDAVNCRSGAEVMERQLVTVYIRNLIQEKFQEQFTYDIFFNLMNECILLGLEELSQMQKILFWLNDAARESRRVMGIQLTIGIGKIKNSLFEMPDALAEAKEALMYRRLSGENDVIYMQDIDISGRKVDYYDAESSHRLFAAVRFGEGDGIRNIVQEMCTGVKNSDMNQSDYQAYCISVLNEILMFVREQNIRTEEIFGGVPNYLEILKQHESPDSFFGWIETICIKLRSYFVEARENKTKDIIEIAKQYMYQEYGNQDISLEKVAEKVGLTPTYFSTIFKKETGGSFVEYLTDIRMEAAMKMLRYSDDKIYVVAQKIGYPEAGYFSHVFKKKYGISPVQCRRESRK